MLFYSSLRVLKCTERAGESFEAYIVMSSSSATMKKEGDKKINFFEGGIKKIYFEGSVAYVTMRIVQNCSLLVFILC